MFYVIYCDAVCKCGDKHKRGYIKEGINEYYIDLTGRVSEAMQFEYYDEANIYALNFFDDYKCDVIEWKIIGYPPKEELNE